MTPRCSPARPRNWPICCWNGEQLQEAGADEMIISTITHNHVDRVRSYRLLAEGWQRR
ncbi:hypothetical protein [Streptomyces sp. NPDC002250]|uniref:hypothetical protein n=1 Tax=Streptomyces sp. NPDC002250 TaxID=3364641 RepID=UPI0036C7F9B1